ncbi:MAG: hypothetical protein ACTSSN_04745 [Candidatus Heimdallarchaeaceae archaeon]
MYKFKVILVFIVFTSSGLFYQVNDSNHLAWQEVDISVINNDIPMNFIYWSEWQKSKPYPIDGKAESVDKYPLNVSLERLDITFAYFLISLLLIGLATNIKKKSLS